MLAQRRALQSLFGSAIRLPAEPAQLNAKAFAQHNAIHRGPGREQHLAHEAWHIVQQMQRRVRPTIQMAENAVNGAEGLEREADVMGANAVQQVANNSPGVAMGAPPLDGCAPVQMVRIGFVPANPNDFRCFTQRTGFTRASCADGQFTETQKTDVYVDNTTNAGSNSAPVFNPGYYPCDDFNRAVLLHTEDAAKIAPEIDHIVPRAEGGANDYDNARVLSKGNNTSSVSRPAPSERRLRLYESISMSARIPIEGRPDYVFSEEQMQAGADLRLEAASLLSWFTGGPWFTGQVTELDKDRAVAICRAPKGTANGVTIR